MKIQIKTSATQGHGVYATAKIRRNERAFLFAETVRQINHHTGCHCALCKRCIQVGPSDWLYPAPESFGWYLNHSCEPNCGIKGHHIVAMRTIQPGEEITIDYSTTNIDRLWKMKCSCRQPNCRKSIRSVIHMTPEWFSKYQGWMPSFIEQTHRNNPKLHQA